MIFSLKVTLIFMITYIVFPLECKQKQVLPHHCLQYRCIHHLHGGQHSPDPGIDQVVLILNQPANNSVATEF